MNAAGNQQCVFFLKRMLTNLIPIDRTIAQVVGSPFGKRTSSSIKNRDDPGVAGGGRISNSSSLDRNSDFSSSHFSGSTHLPTVAMQAARWSPRISATLPLRRPEIPIRVYGLFRHRHQAFRLLRTATSLVGQSSSPGDSSIAAALPLSKQRHFQVFKASSVREQR